jgi:hypothetical protein
MQNDLPGGIPAIRPMSRGTGLLIIFAVWVFSWGVVLGLGMWAFREWGK